MQAVLYGLMQQNPDFPLMLDILAAALEGNGKGFVSTSTPTIDMFWAIVLLCNDNRKLDILFVCSCFQLACLQMAAVDDPTFAAFQRMYAATEEVIKPNRVDIASKLTSYCDA